MPACGGDSFESYSCGSALYVRTAGGETNKLLDGGTKRLYGDPSWSADGKRIVYVGPKAHIWVMNIRTKQASRVTSTGADQRRRPVFSPNGRRIMFGMFVGQRSERALFTIPASGGKKRRILKNLAGGPAQAVYSPKGDRVAFEYWPKNADDPYASGIYTARLDGTGLRRITGVSNHDREPDWSPNGSRIVFYRENKGSTDIYTAKADGSGGLRRLTKGAQAVDPVWSPNGKRIAYVRENLHDDVWTMRASDGRNKQAVLSGPESTNSVDWQPK